MKFIKFLAEKTAETGVGTKANALKQLEDEIEKDDSRILFEKKADLELVAFVE